MDTVFLPKSFVTLFHKSNKILSLSYPGCVSPKPKKNLFYFLYFVETIFFIWQYPVLMTQYFALLATELTTAFSVKEFFVKHGRRRSLSTCSMSSKKVEISNLFYTRSNTFFSHPTTSLEQARLSFLLKPTIKSTNQF